MEEKKTKFWIAVEKEIKKAWDFLNDKTKVRFTLSVKLYRDGVRKPKTIVMKGERFAEGGWNTWFPKRRKNSGALPSAVILKEKLARIEELVHKYIVENALDADWKEHKELLKKQLKLGLSDEDLERRETPIWAIAASGYEAHFCAPILATAYAMEGTKALAKNDLDRAAHCIAQGLHWSSQDMLIPSPNDRFTERAGEGGKGKALRHEPVKDKVAELLMKLAPKEGWESTESAIKDVTTELTFNHSKFVEACGLTTENLPGAIGGWVQADPQRFPHRLRSKS